MIEGLQSFQNVFKIPELKRRVLITLGLLAAYRLGAHVPTPGIDGSALAEFFNQMQGTLLGMVDLFSGGNLRRLTVFALGIMPYISASIILQLLTVVIPALERLAKEGEAGKKKITQYTRYGTVGLCAFQSVAIAIFLNSLGQGIVIHWGPAFVLMTALTLTTFAVMATAAYLPYSRLGPQLGLVPLPASFWLWMLATLAGYAILAHTVKTWFVKKFGND